MKKNIYFIFIIVLVICNLFLPVQLVNATTDDYGNTFQSAEYIDSSRVIFFGNIDYSGDKDIFKVNISSTGIYIICTVSEKTANLASGIELPDGSFGLNHYTEVDSYGILYDANGNVIMKNDDCDGLNFGMNIPLEQGTYYLEVRGFGSSTGAYVLAIR